MRYFFLYELVNYPSVPPQMGPAVFKCLIPSTLGIYQRKWPSIEDGGQGWDLKRSPGQLAKLGKLQSAT